MMTVTDCVYFSGMKELAVCNLANAEKASLIGTKSDKSDKNQACVFPDTNMKQHTSMEH